MTDRLITTPLTQMTTSSPAGGSAQDAHDAPTGTLWSPSVSVDKTVVISDLHLGIDDRYSETIANRTLLLDFLRTGTVQGLPTNMAGTSVHQSDSRDN